MKQNRTEAKGLTKALLVKVKNGNFKPSDFKPNTREIANRLVTDKVMKVDERGFLRLLVDNGMMP